MVVTEISDLSIFHLIYIYIYIYIYVHMTSIFNIKNVYIDKLHNVVNKYKNIYHSTIKMSK